LVVIWYIIAAGVVVLSVLAGHFLSKGLYWLAAVSLVFVALGASAQARHDDEDRRLTEGTSASTDQGQPSSNDAAGAGSTSSTSTSPSTTTAVPTTTTTTTTSTTTTTTTIPVSLDASLASLPVVDGTSYENEPPAVVDGIEYTDAVRMARSVFGDVRLEYNLEGRYRRLTGIVGFTDDAYDWQLHNESESWSMHWEVRVVSIENGTERVLFSARLQNGQTAPFDIDVSGVRRLELAVEESDAPRLSGSLEADVVVWGNPRLIA
jgi:hypothetical protein